VEQNVLDVVLHELGLHDEALLLGAPQIRLQGADNLVLVLLIATQQILQLLASERQKRKRNPKIINGQMMMMMGQFRGRSAKQRPKQNQY